MTFFDSNGIEIFYEIHGKGEPVILVHGFASNVKVNWLSTGWVSDLKDAGYQAIVMDNRGHGRSQKLYQTSYYPADVMAEDVLALIDHLHVAPAHLLGYSMGSRISTFAAIKAPEKVKSLTIGGMGVNLVNGVGNALPIVDALLAQNDEDVKSHVGKMFRNFAQNTGSDLRALAACMAAARTPIKQEALDKLDLPVLVVAGSEDDIAGSVPDLVEKMPNAQGVTIKGRNHMRLTGDKKFKAKVIDFYKSLAQ